VILKGSQRSGSRQLAAHLLKTENNEHVEVHDIRGFMSDNLQGAFHEAYATSRGTRCRQFLFSLSLNPPENETVPVAVFEDTIGRVENKLGLQDQPRGVVFHEKEGRRHAHCVWSRINTDEMKAVHLPHFKLKLADISKELYLEHNWKMPKGFIDKNQKSPFNFTTEVSQKLKSLVAVSIGLRLFLIGFAPNVANPIKYTPTCPDSPLKTGKLQFYKGRME
jgi:hypothetical protein